MSTNHATHPSANTAPAHPVGGASAHLWYRPLTSNEMRQCLRIAFGCTTGFLLCKLFGWNYGVFYTVTPVLLLGMVPVMNGHAARQLIAAAVVCGV
ncbi:DUF2955 domain-containing protein, partial [Aeromonas veronii]|nr:DUF2955 domain-containing protein [Aeromonas veronii]